MSFVNNSTNSMMSPLDCSVKNLSSNLRMIHLNDPTNSNSALNRSHNSMMVPLDYSTKNIPRNLPTTHLNNSTYNSMITHLNNSSKNLSRNSPNTHFNDSTNNSKIAHVKNSIKNLPRNLPTTHLNNSTNKSIDNSAKNLPRNSRTIHYNSIFTLAQYDELYQSFHLNPYPNKTVIREFAMRFAKSVKQMRKWFSTQREKLKGKSCKRKSRRSTARASTRTFNPRSNSGSISSAHVSKSTLDKMKCIVQARQDPVSMNPPSRNFYSSRRSKPLDPISNWDSASTAHASTNAKLVESNSLNPMIFCNCPTQQNSVPINQINPPLPISSIDQPQPFTPQSFSSCPECESSYKFLDPDNLNPSYCDQMSSLMHIPWFTTHPLMNNWPDFSDLYRKMNHNLNRFVNELI